MSGRKAGAELTKHPAPFSQPVLKAIVRILEIEQKAHAAQLKVLDPFAGIGRIHTLPYDTTGVEIEKEWARQFPPEAVAPSRSICGDFFKVTLQEEFFDAICTSPCYGNRFADHHEAKDTSVRRGYRYDLGRMPSPGSSAVMQWGSEYKHFHAEAWLRVKTLLKPNGLFVLNVSDHIRKGERQRVVEWHMLTCIMAGFELERLLRVKTPRLRLGNNSALRVSHEVVMAFRKNKEIDGTA